MVDKVSTGFTEGKGYPIQGWGAWESSRGGGIAVFLQTVIQSKVSQKEKSKNRLLMWIHGLEKWDIQTNLFAGQEQRSR